jgi:hypothetical protein
VEEDPSLVSARRKYVRAMNSTLFNAELKVDSESTQLIARTYFRRERFSKKRGKFNKIGIVEEDPSLVSARRKCVRAMNSTSFDAE